MSEVTRRVRTRKILTFPIDEGVFGKLENRFGVIPYKYKKCEYQERSGGTVGEPPLYHG